MISSPILHLFIFNFRNAIKESLTKIDPSQLWKISGTTLINKTTTWQSGQKWKFKPVENEGSKIYIENISNNKVLAPPGNYRVTVEAFDEQNARQKWKKGLADGQGFFTLENISSEKFLTAVSKNSLIIENLR